jgi:hypothetical protein
MSAFTITIADEVITDLRSRLDHTRFTQPSADGWNAGVDPAYLRSLIDYWAHEFDWRAAEDRLNSYPQFLHQGQHFVHVRRDVTRPPVLLTAGRVASSRCFRFLICSTSMLWCRPFLDFSTQSYPTVRWPE